MKRTLPYLIAAIIAGVTFPSCSKDFFDSEDPENISWQIPEKVSTDTITPPKTDTTKKETVNYWKIGETSHELTSSVVVDYGNRGNNTYDFELHLYTGTLSETASAKMSGSGHRLRLGIITSQQSLVAGTYKYSNKDFSAGVLADMYSTYITDYENGESTKQPGMFKSGSVTITKKEKSIHIDFSLISDSDIVFKGHYEGALTYFKR